MSSLQTTRFMVPNNDGWQLELHRHVVEDALDPTRRPLLMVPGYAMNAYILGYHPSDISMVEHLAREGHEVWTTNMRGQGGARRDSGARRRYGLGELALVDLPAVLGELRERTRCTAPGVDVVGCSLGASVVYAYLAHHPDDHGVGSVIAVGGPLRWVEVHPLLSVAFKSPRLAGLLPIVGTRALARRALPLLRHAPPLLSLYMNARRIDLSQPERLVPTVDDPVPSINRQVARWVQDGDLVVRGLDVTEALAAADVDVLVVLANRDGIVPAATALSVASVLPRDRVEVLRVGNDQHWYAHADLFIGVDARTDVFVPMARWLARHQAD